MMVFNIKKILNFKSANNFMTPSLIILQYYSTYHLQAPPPQSGTHVASVSRYKHNTGWMCSGSPGVWAWYQYHWGAVHQLHIIAWNSILNWWTWTASDQATQHRHSLGHDYSQPNNNWVLIDTRYSLFISLLCFGGGFLKLPVPYDVCAGVPPWLPCLGAC